MNLFEFDDEQYLPPTTPAVVEEDVVKSMALGWPIIANYGGGVNSTAMVIQMLRRGLRPAVVLFCDTGDEHPHTLEYLKLFDEWLRDNYQLSITTCRNESPHKTLEGECINNKTLPSLAFGFRGCSTKWKRQPMDRWIKQYEPAINARWKNGGVVYRCIGIHAGESHRGNIPSTNRFRYWRPLVDWGILQEECESIITAAGLPVPRKSSCWHCPAKTKREVLEFAREEPELFRRAVAMERNARDAGGLKAIKGLGRHWGWEALVKADCEQSRLWPEIEDRACIWCND